MAPRKSTGLLRNLEKTFGPVVGLEEFRPLERIVLMMLAHGSDAQTARSLVKRIQTEYVDWNEVRVTSPYEIGNLLHKLGSSAGRRADQIRELLVFVYNRFNKLSLDCLLNEDLGPEERRKRDRFESWMLDRAKAIVAEDVARAKAAEKKPAPKPKAKKVKKAREAKKAKKAKAPAKPKSARVTKARTPAKPKPVKKAKAAASKVKAKASPSKKNAKVTKTKARPSKAAKASKTSARPTRSRGTKSTITDRKKTKGR
jgi:hypothetical protein